MIIVVIALALVGFGWALKLPAKGIAAMLALLWAAALLAQVVLPPTNPLARAIGGTWQSWLGLGVVVGLVIAYLGLLRGLRAKASTTEVVKSDGFSDAELDRYARHIMLREVGGVGQKRLKSARVLVVGAGGLGSPVLLYLAAAGVGTIGVIDDDTVSNSNLQRQIIHTDARIGMPKVFSAELAMRALNPFTQIRPYNRRLAAADAEALFAEYDLILDGSDNFETRYLVNAAAVAAGKPLISAAITQWEGQISLYDPAQDAPCYACIFPKAPAPGLVPSCAEAGVMGALPGVVGAMMATEAIKEITGAGQSLRGRMLIYDALYGENRQIGVKQRAACEICGSGPP